MKVIYTVFSATVENNDEGEALEALIAIRPRDVGRFALRMKCDIALIIDSTS